MNRSSRELVLLSRPMNTITFADGAWEGRSRSEEGVKVVLWEKLTVLHSELFPFEEIQVGVL